LLMKLEAPPGFEPGVEVLQTSALPLGDGALVRERVTGKSFSGRHFCERRPGGVLDQR
jgi:hypothetical protein